MTPPADVKQRGRANPKGRKALDEFDACDVMTPGVVAIADNASVGDAVRAMGANGVDALLVVGSKDGTPLGWVTTDGLLESAGRNGDSACTREAITESVTGIPPTASARAALYALSLAGISRLVVRGRGEVFPQGVVTESELALL